MAVLTAQEHARVAYDALAPAYDLLTADYDHGRWLGEVERLCVEHGLRGRRLLDVACGTGKSFLPLLERGYAVTACDLSPRMAARARRKAAGRATVLVADMRALPRLGRFDLATCLDDAFNYLTEEGEVEAALRGIRANLQPGGLLVFDVNTLSGLQAFAAEWVVEGPGQLVAWRGAAGGPLAAGDAVEARIDVFHSDGGDAWRRTVSVHRQRHHPVDGLARLVERCGFELAACLGQRPGVALDSEVDESVHAKALFVARADEGEERT